MRKNVLTRQIIPVKTIASVIGSLVASMSDALRPRGCKAVVLAFRLALVPEPEVRNALVVQFIVATEESRAKVAHPWNCAFS